MSRKARRCWRSRPPSSCRRRTTWSPRRRLWPPRARSSTSRRRTRSGSTRCISAQGARTEGLAAEPGRSGYRRKAGCAAPRSRSPRCAIGCASSARAMPRSTRWRARRPSQFNPEAIVAAPIDGTVVQRQVGLGQNIVSQCKRWHDPGVHDRRPVRPSGWWPMCAKKMRRCHPSRRRRSRCTCWPIPAGFSRRGSPTSRRRSILTRTGCRCAPKSKTRTAR